MIYFHGKIYSKRGYIMFGEVGYIIGQGLSILAVIAGFISFQMKSAKGILFLQILTAVLFTGHFLLIGEMIGVALDGIATVQCIAYYYVEKLKIKRIYVSLFFTAIIIAASIITWGKWYSVFIMLGLALNAIALSLQNPQSIRKMMLIKSPLCLIYNVFVFSIGGIIYESASLCSSIIGIIRNRKSVKKQNEEI